MDECRALIESKAKSQEARGSDLPPAYDESAYDAEMRPKEAEERKMLNDDEVDFTSLCYVAKDNDDRVWLYRLADVEDGRLIAPYKSEHTDNFFENRDRLYQKDGPSAIGTVGVWNWTADPNRNNPVTDYVQSSYCKSCSPVRVVVLSVKSLDDVVEQLKNGTAHTQPYLCDTFFCYKAKWGQFTGLPLCQQKNPTDAGNENPCMGGSVLSIVRF